MAEAVIDRGEVDGLVEWATAGGGLDDGASGDAAIVTTTSYGALLGVVDALGHGIEAAETARVAIATLARHSEAGLSELVELCGEAVRKLRGCVATLARLDTASSTLTWVAVGNVSGVLLRASSTRSPEAVTPRGGVIGNQVPSLRLVTHPVGRGDVLILSTDGVRDGFANTIAIEHDVGLIASSIIERHGRGTDDALVLVARFRGGV